MGIHTFALTGYDILDTRSQHEDTNYITAALSVNDQIVGSPQTRFMGNQNNGSFQVGFTWKNVNTDAGDVTLLYQILNSGHKDHGGLVASLADFALQQLPSGAPVVDWKGKLRSLLLADCDGPIAPPEGRKLVWHAFELDPMAPGTTSGESVQEKGNDSPNGCGGNSHYVVHVSVTA